MEDIKIGSIIRIAISGEGFFVKVNMKNNDRIYATIRNNLVGYHDREFDFTFGDSIVFKLAEVGEYTEILHHTSYCIHPRMKE